MEVISIIIPCYNEEDSIPLIYNELKKVSNNMKYDFEFIFVNDGSIDNSLSVLKKLSARISPCRHTSVDCKLYRDLRFLWLCYGCYSSSVPTAFGRLL